MRSRVAFAFLTLIPSMPKVASNVAAMNAKITHKFLENSSFMPTLVHVP
jgi:hypothetical protein